MELSWSSVVARRMQRQGLVGGVGDIAATVAAMGGAHAQVMSAAELSIGVRVADATPDSIRGALRPEGPLVKTYGPRGTVHLLPRTELPLWCAALSAVPVSTSLPADVRLDNGQRDAVVDAIGDALAAEGQMDGDQLGAAVVARLGAWSEQRVVPAFGGWSPRWRLGIQIAATRGVLAFGDNRGSRVTYVNPGVRPDTDTPAALAWLLHRYLATYGPASPQHYGRWLGVRKSWAATQFTSFADELQGVIVEGVPTSVNLGDAGGPTSSASGVTLLPHFDPYVIGGFPRELLFPGVAATRALGGGQAGVHPVLLVDGVVAGIWTATRKAARLAITVEPLVSLSRSQRAGLRLAADRVAGFLSTEAELTLGTVTVGAHK